MENLTKKELIKLAKTLEIKGAHDMNKEQLIAVIKLVQAEKAAEEKKELAARSQSTNERDPETGLVIRKGKNLSGNVPWKCKYYYVNKDAEGFDLSKLAPQARKMIEFMIAAEVTDVENCAIGKDVVDGMKEQGWIKTPIESANLFAYYRRKMEIHGGLIHAI